MGEEMTTELREKITAWEIACGDLQDKIDQEHSRSEITAAEWIVIFKLADVGRSYLRSIGKNVEE
jgi:hypothetical protein